MSERITIVLNDDIAKRLRIMQDAKIRKRSSSVSFSRVINETLEKGMK